MRQVLPDDGGWGFRRPGEGGTVVDVPELLAARNGQEVRRPCYELPLRLRFERHTASSLIRPIVPCATAVFVRPSR